MACGIFFINKPVACHFRQTDIHTMKFALFLSSVFLVVFAGAGDKVGAPAPAFTGKTADGHVISLADYEGKVVLLDFWASWCGPCKEEMPFLVHLQRQYASKGLMVIAVNIDDDVANMKAFLSSLPGARPQFPIIWDQQKLIPQRYEIGAMPTSVLIDKKGIVQYWHNGFRTSKREQFRKEIALLVNEN